MVVGSAALLPEVIVLYIFVNLFLILMYVYIWFVGGSHLYVYIKNRACIELCRKLGVAMYVYKKIHTCTNSSQAGVYMYSKLEWPLRFCVRWPPLCTELV